MFRFIYTTILIILMASAQSVMETDIRPDFLLIITIYLGMRFGPMTGQLTGFFCGILIEDMSFYEPFGITIFYLTVIGFVSGFLRNKIFRSNILIPMITIFAASLLKYPLFMLIEYIYKGEFSSNAGEFLLTVMPFELMINILLYPIFYLILKRIDKRWVERKDELSTFL